ncbi:hypothetical protein DPM19_16080 [Actinomadura craniellae]|uniref:DUF6879 domain-containing protein n=2 Tax=Actinomadura craniellae TaxID=2231787 RepID=A0A365H670_9ACTN|nr:hypothetical protein DPM19_16080 [Actinomadura craniellae]
MIREALDGYERGRSGPGEPTFAQLLANTKHSAVHLELRDTYDPQDPEFLDWQAGGDGGVDDESWERWTGLIGSAVERGVRVRRARVVSEPLSDCARFLHSVTDKNIKAGEEVRWLPRRRAFDLFLPGADLWMFDQRLVRWNFNAGDGTDTDELEYTTDPRVVSQVVAAFELVWERATPHGEYRL